MGALFGMLGGFYCWFPKIVGKRYNETLAQIQFWTLFIGVERLPLALYLAICEDIYQKVSSYYKKVNTYIWLYINFVLRFMGFSSLKTAESLIIIKNEDIRIKENSSRQSAEVFNKQILISSQRINAKEIWYLLGFIEADGAILCYKEKQYIRAELVIGLEESDIKLLYWVKKLLGYGSVKLVNHSDQKNFPGKKICRYQARSKVLLNQTILHWYCLYPPIMKNKWNRVIRLKNSLKDNIYYPIKDYPIERSENISLYIKDWIIGFIEGDGSFYFVDLKNGTKRAEFNISQKEDKEGLELIAHYIGISPNIYEKKNNQYLLVAVSTNDLQKIINFMCNGNREKLKGLKKVKFLSWLSELRTSSKYSTLKIPNKY